MTLHFLSFLCCVTTIVLSEGSVLRSGDQIVQCAETELKVEGHCGTSDASLCRAVENVSLALTCSPCDEQDTVHWFFGRKEVDPPQQNKTLLLAAVNVTNENASGCYQCLCEKGGHEIYFTVQVGLQVPITFLVNTVEDGDPTHLDLLPATRNVNLDETSPGIVCINCSAVAYPDLQYRWTYDDSRGNHHNASSDPCLSFYEDQAEVLCFTPTVQNVMEQRTYYCEVSNIFQTVTAQQFITYPGSSEMSEWFVRPHQLQSQGDIPLANGTATAVCAAYPQISGFIQVQYYVCALPNDTEPDDSACLFNRLNCCSCYDDSCHRKLGINVTMDTFYDSLGVPTHGCRVDSAINGSFACVVEKNVSASGPASAKQFIGDFSFVGVPPEVHLMNTSSITALKVDLVSAGIGVAIGIVVILVPFAICFVVLCGCYKRCKKGHVEGRLARPVLNEEDVQQAERRPLLEASQPMMSYDSIEPHNQSMRIIACPEAGEEKVVSQWKLRSDGKPAGVQSPQAGVQSPPAGVQSPPAGVQSPPAGVQSPPAGVQSPPAGVQSPPAGVQSPPAGVQSPPAGVQSPPAVVQSQLARTEQSPGSDPNLPNNGIVELETGGSSQPKPRHVRDLFKSPAITPSPHKGAPSPSRSEPVGHSRQSSSPLSSASPSAAHSPKVYLTEGQEQGAGAAEISLSVDGKKIYLPVKPGTTYILDVPPHPEPLTMKFKTFGKRRWTEPLPHDIEDVFPVDIHHLVRFVQPLAHCWDRIGHSLSVHKVRELVNSSGDGAYKMTRVFEAWVDKSPQWETLLSVLDEMELMATAASIRAFLHTEYSKLSSGGRPSPEHDEQ